jgi:hypothetical protein
MVLAGPSIHLPNEPVHAKRFLDKVCEGAIPGSFSFVIDKGTTLTGSLSCWRSRIGLRRLGALSNYARQRTE